MTRESQAAPLYLQHVLEPRLDPAAIDDVTLHRQPFCNQRCKPAAVAHAEKENLVAIDKGIVPEMPKGLTVCGQLRGEICRSAIALGIADTLLLEPHGREARNLGHRLKHALSAVPRARWRFNRVAA